MTFELALEEEQLTFIEPGLMASILPKIIPLNSTLLTSLPTSL